MNDSKLSSFFTTIGPQIIDFVEKKTDKPKIMRQKVDPELGHNFVTEVDLAMETFIMEEIQKSFPNDSIVSEETAPNTSLDEKGRLWIIDPICGTGNLERGVRFYATNIALAIDGKLKAACVADHNNGSYIWTSGKDELFLNEKPFTPKKFSGIFIEIDLSSLISAPKKERIRYSGFVDAVIKNPRFHLVSWGTSLGFSYAALGKVDAYVSPLNHVWDIAAPNCLLQNSGGIVTDFIGESWILSEKAALGSRNKELHQELLQLLQDHYLR